MKSCIVFFPTVHLKDSTQMIEADVLLRGHDPKEPIMAHPPENDSDITLEEWLRMVVIAGGGKGIKLDFKRLENSPGYTVGPVSFLRCILHHLLLKGH